LKGLRPLVHLLSLLNQITLGIEIYPRCAIGLGIFFPHTSGTAIGASKTGKDARVYLGARQIDMSYDLSPRSGLGDCVVIGAGAKVLGGISLGDNVKMGGNSVLPRFVSPGATVAWIPRVKSTHPNRIP
jgi:serine O-acetyltransferase